MNQTTAFIIGAVLAFAAFAAFNHSGSYQVEQAGSRTMWIIAGSIATLGALLFIGYAAKGNRFRSDD